MKKSVTLRHNSSIHNYLIILQLFLLSGNPGANGLIVRQHVAMDPEFGVVDAVSQLLGEMSNVLEILLSLKIA